MHVAISRFRFGYLFRSIRRRTVGVRRRIRYCRDLSAQAGMATAEYAIATLAACGFAGLLLTILKSGEVKGMLIGIVRRALTV